MAVPAPIANLGWFDNTPTDIILTQPCFRQGRNLTNEYQLKIGL
jgi:hypothetical protein